MICAPVFSSGAGLSTQVAVGPDEGLKHSSWIMCDNLVSLRKSDLTDYVGSLKGTKLTEMNPCAESGSRFDLESSSWSSRRIFGVGPQLIQRPASRLGGVALGVPP
ncbi:MAG TPA: type II toxin-antitoxin system PemK/MazF family toxin [Terriglobia bacterium]